MKKEEIFEYVKKQYGTVPEYLWAQSPDNAVLRHKNGKWYAVVMTVEKSKLGLEGKDPVDIMDVKCDPDMTNIMDCIVFPDRYIYDSQRILQMRL